MSTTILMISAAGVRGMMSPVLSVRDQGLAANDADDVLTGRQGNVVRLEIHYESLCPSCHELLLDSLRPIWQDEELRARLDLQMFPAGNVITIPVSEVSEGYRFWHPEVEEEDADSHIFVCQHGGRECLGNAIHACAMRLLTGPAEYLPLVFCMAKAAGAGSMVEKASFECMQELGINATEISQCAKAPSANGLMYGIANYSNRLLPQRTYTPWVVVDGHHDEAADEGDLLGSVCAVLGEPAPSACVMAAAAGSPGGIWGTVQGWLGAVQTSGEVVDLRSDGSSNSLGFSHRQPSDAL